MQKTKAQNIDTTFLEGKSSAPLVVFIHGLGMDKRIWTDPAQSRIIAGSFPITILVGKKPQRKVLPEDKPRFRRITTGTPPKKLLSLFHLLHEKGFSVLSWSQKRPVGPAHAALEELSTILDLHHSFTGNGIILIGHSRGGLLARSYALENPDAVRVLITLGTPFRGSTLARWAGLLSRALVFVEPFFPQLKDSTAQNAVKRMRDFIKSSAVKELLPDSPFLQSLERPLAEHIRTLCIAGTNPHFFSLYRWRNRKTDASSPRMIEPVELFSFPDSLRGLVPDELKKGRGDGLVAHESAIISPCDETATYPLNHVELLFSKEVHIRVWRFLSGISRA